MAEKVELVITALQQRIGELVADYETKIAVLRAEITQLVNEKEQRDKAVQEYSDKLSTESN
jgi:uncharacterized small protein (DUF1192 family)